MQSLRAGVSGGNHPTDCTSWRIFRVHAGSEHGARHGRRRQCLHSRRQWRSSRHRGSRQHPLSAGSRPNGCMVASVSVAGSSEAITYSGADRAGARWRTPARVTSDRVRRASSGCCGYLPLCTLQQSLPELVELMTAGRTPETRGFRVWRVRTLLLMTQTPIYSSAMNMSSAALAPQATEACQLLRLTRWRRMRTMQASNAGVWRPSGKHLAARQNGSSECKIRDAVDSALSRSSCASRRRTSRTPADTP